MAHRSYDSILPSANKLLSKKWDSTRFNAHRTAIKNVKSATDSSAPPTYVHMHIKMKKLQLEEERLAQIQHDNRLLLEKMSSIMRGKSQVDHLNDYSHKSLNKEKRQRDLLTITQENQEILKRIQAKAPSYDHKAWEGDYKKSQELKKAITRYPEDGSPTKQNLDDTTFDDDAEKSAKSAVDHHEGHADDLDASGEGHTAARAVPIAGAVQSESTSDPDVQVVDGTHEQQSSVDGSQVHPSAEGEASA